MKMTALQKGLILSAVHAGIVLSAAGKLIVDRATLPRVWAPTRPVDPNLPIRGRYVRLNLEIPAAPGASGPVTLAIEDGRLVARPTTGRSEFYLAPGQNALLERIAFFIPEHVPDPSIRAPGEQLWAEVTVPRSGPPRPIRLGVKKDDGPIVPLDLR